MKNSYLIKFPVIFSLITVLAGCQNMPGTRKQQGAVIGGAAGAATGAVIADDNRALGALLGGLLGAGGGYVIAAETGKVDTDDQQGAATAARKAQENPATAADAQKALTADLNYDGFVTLDEVVAMKQAGFTDAQMLQRLRGTDQVFELTADHEQYLRDRGVSRQVISQMKQINRGADASTLGTSRGSDVIGQPR